MTNILLIGTADRTRMPRKESHQAPRFHGDKRPCELHKLVIVKSPNITFEEIAENPPDFFAIPAKEAVGLLTKFLRTTRIIRFRFPVWEFGQGRFVKIVTVWTMKTEQFAQT